MNGPTTDVATEREPAWDVALLFPPQGEWGEDDYLILTRSGNRLVELSDGTIEVLSMPTTSHQRIVAALYRLLAACVEPRRLGTLLFAPLRVRLWPGKIREPDLVFMRAEHADRIGEQVWQGADLVVEVVSRDDRRRDTDVKRSEYAAAGIPEYWIVDPDAGSVIVLCLAGVAATTYAVDGTYTSGRGETIRSRVLPACAVPVDDLPFA